MKILSIRNEKIQYLVKYCSNRKIEIFYIFILLSGVFIGAFFSGKSFINSFDRSVFFENFLLSRNNLGFIDVFLNTFTSGFVYLILSYFSGMFAFGSVSNGLILIFKGSSIGFLMGYSYLSYGLKGVIFAIIIILPSAFITSFCLIYSAEESFIFSLNFLKLFTNNLTLKPIKLEFKRYCVKHLIFLFIIVISALVDGTVTKLFYNVINL